MSTLKETIGQAMSGITPNPDFFGAVTTDDYFFGITDDPNADVNDYWVAWGNISAVDASMNPETQDSNYIHEGKSTTKTATQTTYNITGDRHPGYKFQDYILSHKMKYAKGAEAVVHYVYFCALTGKGEKGQATVVVNSPGGGAAGENAAFDVDFLKYGAEPEEFTYTPPTTPTTRSTSTKSAE